MFWKNWPDHIKYGVVVFIAVWFAGWSTGMGGSWLPNVVFSLLMGVFAAFCFRFVTRKPGGGDK